jgi:hypothetical protein
MKNHLREQLENEITRIWHIILEAKESLDLSFYLHQPNTQEELDFITVFSSELRFIRQILWKNGILELTKVFRNESFKENQNEQFNIFKLISRLQSDGHYRSAQVDTVALDNWNNTLSKHQKTIQQILDLRDNIYAHTSTKGFKIENDVSFQDLQKLVNTAEVIIAHVFKSIFGISAVFDIPVFFDRGRFDLISVLATERKERAQKIFDSYKFPKNESGK